MNDHNALVVERRTVMYHKIIAAHAAYDIPNNLVTAGAMLVLARSLVSPVSVLDDPESEWIQARFKGQVLSIVQHLKEAGMTRVLPTKDALEQARDEDRLLSRLETLVEVYSEVPELAQADTDDYVETLVATSTMFAFNVPHVGEWVDNVFAGPLV